MQFKLFVLIVGILSFSLTVQALADPYTIEVSRSFEDSHQGQNSANPTKNGARPSFRQYNTGTDYSSQNQQQQYGYSNGASGQYSPYDSQSQQQFGGQRYPQYTGAGTNQNGFQRDPRFNGAQATFGTSAALCSAAFLAMMRIVFN